MRRATIYSVVVQPGARQHCGVSTNSPFPAPESSGTYANVGGRLLATPHRVIHCGRDESGSRFLPALDLDIG